jgi:two-component system, chemotaxis family, sensor kinase CheA
MLTDRDRLVQQLLATYVDELEGHVAALNRDLLTLEKAAPEAVEEPLHALFRTVHTIKGSSRAAGAVLVEQVTHHLEDVLSVLRERRLGRDPKLFELLFGVTDAIARTGEGLRQSEPEDPALFASFLPQLSQLAQSARAPDVSSPLQSSTQASPSPSGHSLRLAPERLDELVAQSGELRVAHGRVRQRAEELGAFRAELAHWIAPKRKRRAATHEVSRRGPHAAEPGAQLEAPRLLAAFDRLSTSLAEDQRRLGVEIGYLDLAVRGLRMVPFEEACGGLERALRDLATASSKQVTLRIQGNEVELDRAVVDALRPSLLQLVRNAIDHGIEAPGARAAAGKRPEGMVSVSATLRGSEIVITVEDDGQGIDVGAVRAQLRRRRLPEPERPQDLARSIFTPGFSTARLITDISGRGVGLDVVKRAVEAVRGSVDLAFRPGHGTRFSLVVPLTLTTLRGLLVRVQGQTFVVPGASVQRLLRVGAEDVRSIAGVESIEVDATTLPVVGLWEVLAQPRQPELAQGKVPVVVAMAQGDLVGLVVDELLEEREVVVKSLGPRLRGARAVSGATVLSNGRLGLILNMAEVVSRARRQARSTAILAPVEEADGQKREILLVDDSITTRTLERSILEAAGYVVRVAVDGREAWTLLQEHGADLVVSDVEMPELDGFALTEAIRASPRFRDIPVVLVTALASDADKARGLSVGANAYLVKSTFDQQNLLETVAQLV